jgi:hypothetical protein
VKPRPKLTKNNPQKKTGYLFLFTLFPSPAARIGFRIDPEIQEATKLPEVPTALTTKISRERIGKEVRRIWTSFLCWEGSLNPSKL